MPLVITDEKYGGLPSLHANAGDWKACEVTFFSRFDYESSEFAQVVYNEIAGQYWLELPASDNWGNYGFAPGQSIDISTTWYYRGQIGAAPGANFDTVQNWSATILYISGNQLFIDIPLVTVPDPGVTSFTSHILNGVGIPYRDDPNNQLDPLVLVVTDAPEQIEFTFNLTQNGSTSLNSVIDGELIRLSSTDIASLLVGGTTNLTQSGNKSGGYIKNVVLTYDSIDGSNYRAYKINFEILQWGFIQSGFNEPNYYNFSDNIAPIANIKVFALSGNPNTIQEVSSSNTEADTGGFDENYNGDPSLYSLQSIDWEDSLGNPISAMDYSGVSRFDAVINAPGQSITFSTFRIGMVFRPTDDTIYQNKADSIVNNLLVNAPEIDIIHTVAADPTVRVGFQNSIGVRFDLSDVWFFISGGTVRVRGTVTPNAAAISFFDNIPDGGRKMTLWASIGDHTVDNTNISKRVNLKMHDQDVIDAPTIGVQIPNVISTEMIDHAGLPATPSAPPFQSTITTEDDVLFQMCLRLVDGVLYESMIVKLIAENTTDNETFELEKFNFSFDGLPEIAGQFQPNFSINRGFNLPPSTDRNIISLKRDSSLDVAGQYGIKILYGFLSRWEYWLSQNNANNAFYDVSQPNDGKNKDWQRYSDASDWRVSVVVNTVAKGVADFNEHVFEIRPYDDEDCDTVVTITRVSDGAVITSFEDNEIHDVEAQITWNTGGFTDPWAEATIEDFESGNRWLISSVLDYGFAANPLSPIPGSTLLDLSFLGSVATLKMRVDTNKVSASKISMSYRISDPSDAITGKLTTDDLTKGTTADEIKILA